MATCTGTTLTGEKCKNKCKGTTCFLHTSTMECSICLQQIPSFAELKLPNCVHVFHKNCINRWKKDNNTCPCCRTLIEDTMYKVVVSIEPIGVRNEIVLNDIRRISEFFGIDNFNDFLTEIEFESNNYEDIRQVLTEIGFPVTTLPERTQ
jgi:hypothetical protein